MPLAQTSLGLFELDLRSMFDVLLQFVVVVDDMRTIETRKERYISQTSLRWQSRIFWSAETLSMRV